MPLQDNCDTWQEGQRREWSHARPQFFHLCFSTNHSLSDNHRPTGMTTLHRSSSWRNTLFPRPWRTRFLLWRTSLANLLSSSSFSILPTLSAFHLIKEHSFYKNTYAMVRLFRIYLVSVIHKLSQFADLTSYQSLRVQLQEKGTALLPFHFDPGGVPSSPPPAFTSISTPGGGYGPPPPPFISFSTNGGDGPQTLRFRHQEEGMALLHPCSLI